MRYEWRAEHLYCFQKKHSVILHILLIISYLYIVLFTGIFTNVQNLSSGGMRDNVDGGTVLVKAVVCNYLKKKSEMWRLLL